MKVFTRIIDTGEASRTVSLTYEQRLKHRMLLNLGAEQQVQILLPRGQRLASGVKLRADDGSILQIESAPEALSWIEATGQELARACYHLGNRHIAAAITPTSVAYQTDAVIDSMMQGLGFRVDHRHSRFDPEPGAYSGHHHG